MFWVLEYSNMKPEYPSASVCTSSTWIPCSASIYNNVALWIRSESNLPSRLDSWPWRSLGSGCGCWTASAPDLGQDHPPYRRRYCWGKRRNHALVIMPRLLILFYFFYRLRRRASSNSDMRTGVNSERVNGTRRIRRGREKEYNNINNFFIILEN